MTKNLEQLLKSNSRSFYLTLMALPRAVRPQIGLAYLLARTTDTIADTELIHAAHRLEALERFKERIQEVTTKPLDFGELTRAQDAPSERLLLENAEIALTALKELAPNDRARVRSVLETITSGQSLDLQRFAGADAQHIRALATASELDDYTYRVAGCVGEFWTEMCRAHLFPETQLDMPQLLKDGVRFGKGLQLVNILRDIPRDLRQGRCYIPLDLLSTARLDPRDLLNAENESVFRQTFDPLLEQAEEHLAAGWRYTNTLPRAQVRIRLGCAWSLLIGQATLRKLRQENVLDERKRVKVSRADVRKIIIKSILLYPFSECWRRQFTYGKSGRNAVDSKSSFIY